MASPDVTGGEWEVVFIEWRRASSGRWYSTGNRSPVPAMAMARKVVAHGGRDILLWFPPNSRDVAYQTARVWSRNASA